MFLSTFQQQLFIAFIVAGVLAGVGQGYQFQSLMFILVVIYGALSADQFLALCVVYAVVIFWNGITRASK